MNYLNLIELVVIFVLVIAFMWEIVKNKRENSECKEAVEKILSGNLTKNFKKNTGVFRGFTQITEKMISWIYNTLKSSTRISEQLNSIYSSCTISMETAEKVGGKIDNFEHKAIHTLKRIEELNTLSTNVYNSQQAMYVLSNKVKESANQTEGAIKAGGQNVEDAVGILEDMNIHMENLVKYIENLANVTESVQNMAHLINNLANNINLLSLNASIEAARAGESGKGFAVVATEVGKLADESAAYSKDIKNNIESINNKTGAAIKAINLLSEKSKKVKVSTDSIKTYFQDINIEVNHIINSVHSVSTKIEEQLSTNEKIKIVSDSASEFFKDFNTEVSNIVSDIQKQYKLEKINIFSCDNMSKSIKTMLEFTQEFENIISGKLLNHCKIVADEISKGNIDSDLITKYSKESGISEFYITDEDGVVVISNNESGIGFRFPQEEDAQAHVFREILKNPKAVITQNFMKRDLDGKYYKFVAISRKDGKGIVQAGLDLEEMINLKI